MKKILFLYWLFGVGVFAQDKDKIYKAKDLLREGNELVTAKKLNEAALLYQKSLDFNPSYYKSAQNLGNVYYSLSKYKEASMMYGYALGKATTTKEIAKSLERLGDVSKQSNELENAVNYYKNTLLKDPKNDAVREKYINAKRLLDKQNKNNKDNKKNKDQKQNPKNQDKDPSKNNQQDKKKPEPKKSDSGKNKIPQAQKSNLSKDQIKQLLNSLENEEQKTTQKVNAQKVKVSTKKNEKDW